MKKWLDEPITWRKYLNITSASMLIVALYYGIITCCRYWDDITWEIDEIKTSIKRKFGKN